MDALIGHSGFVGTTLLRQRGFDALFRAADIDGVAGRAFGTVICAAAPAQKWIAERDPDADRLNIGKLADHLDTLQAERFVLISTVDPLELFVGLGCALVGAVAAVAARRAVSGR